MEKISFLNIYEAPKVQRDLDARIMFRSDNNEIIRLTLKSGEEIPLHKNDVDVVFFIIEGNGMFLTSDKEVNIKKDMRIFVKANLDRGIRNNSQAPLNLLVIKKV